VSIGNQIISENVAATTIDANDFSGGDTDPGGEDITYTCYYDTTIDASVANTTACTTLTGVTLNVTTQILPP
jgi:hypothetical protein